MDKRIPRNRRLGLIAAMAALAGASLVACSDSGDDPSAGPAGDGGAGAQVDAGGGADAPEGGGGGEQVSGDKSATVVVDGVTYRFESVEPGTNGTIFTSCTVIHDSVQGDMVMVDDSGAPVEGGELEFILLEPGGVYEGMGDPAHLVVHLPGHEGGGYDADEIDAPASGGTASGSFTATDLLGATISGTIEASC